MRKIKLVKIYRIIGYNSFGYPGVIHKTTDKSTHKKMELKLSKIWKLKTKIYRGIL